VSAVAELIPGFRAQSWNGFLAPTGTPQDIIDMIEKGTIEAANDPEIKQRLISLGIMPVGSTSKELATIIEEDKTFYADAIKIAGLKQI
jgi:tripartite-type tricarboxylate transporter receptor subunit TctC